jgi:hypothetical protein
MDEERGTELVELGPDRLELRIAEIDAVEIAERGEAIRAELFTPALTARAGSASGSIAMSPKCFGYSLISDAPYVLEATITSLLVTGLQFETSCAATPVRSM